MDAPGSEHTRGHHGQRQAGAKGTDQRETERDALQLETDEQHAERRGTRHEPTGDPEEDNLRRGHLTPAEALGDLDGMRPFMGILVFAIMPVAFDARGVAFAKLDACRVGMIAMGEGEQGVELMRLGDLGSGFEKPIPRGKGKNLPRPIITDRFQREVLLAARGASKRQTKYRW